MIKNITFINYLGSYITCNMQNPTIDDESGIFITSVDGLGPQKADVKISDYVHLPGGIYNSSRITVRNIVVNAYYTYAKDVESARLQSYHYFPIGDKIRILVETSQRKVYIEGYVESNEPQIFEEMASVQVSILCPNPFFRDYNNDEQEMLFTNRASAFYFPYYNHPEYPESVTIDTGALGYSNDIFYSHDPMDYSYDIPYQNYPTTDEEMASPNRQNVDQTMFALTAYKMENQLYYNGDVETGVIFRIIIHGPTSNIRVVNTITGEEMTIGSPYGSRRLNYNQNEFLSQPGGYIGVPDDGRAFPYGQFDTGDVIEISTIKRNKYARLISSWNTISRPIPFYVNNNLDGGMTVVNAEYDLLHALGKDPNWLSLKKGNNYLVYHSEVGEGLNMEIIVKSVIYYIGV